MLPVIAIGIFITLMLLLATAGPQIMGLILGYIGGRKDVDLSREAAAGKMASLFRYHHFHLFLGGKKDVIDIQNPKV